MSRHTTDIYRTASAILIHTRPGRPARTQIGLLLLCIVPIVYCTMILFNSGRDHFAWNYAIPVLGFLGASLYFAFSIVYTCCTTRIIRIDSRTVRLDRRFLSFRRSRIFPRTPETRMQRKYDNGQYRLILGTAERSISWAVSGSEELRWVFDEIQKFLVTVPAATGSFDSTKPRFTDADCGEALLESRKFEGRTFERVLSPTEKAAKADDAEIPDGARRPYVRCGKCNAVVPHGKVLPDQGLALCEQCGTLCRLADLFPAPLPPDSLYTVRRTEETLEIRKNCDYRFLPLAIFCWGFLGFAILAAIRQIEFLEIFFLVVVGCCSLWSLWSLWAVVDRRGICIDPERCRLTWNPFFIPWTITIPRQDLLKAGREQARFSNRETVRLLYRGGSFLVEPIIPGGGSFLLGILNHHLYTVPPANPRSGKTRTYLGGGTSEYAEVRTYCPDCGSPAPSANLDFDRQQAVCGSCRRVFTFSESPLRVFPAADRPISNRLQVAKNAERVQITWAAEPAFWKRFEICGPAFAAMLVMVLISLGMDGAITLHMLMLMIISGLFILIITLPVGLRRHFAKWSILLDRKNLEISCQNLFWKAVRTIPREKIFAFSLKEKNYDEAKREGPVVADPLMPQLCPQSQVVAGRTDNELSVRLPGFPFTSARTNADGSVWLMNELNDFLGRARPVSRGPESS